MASLQPTLVSIAAGAQAVRSKFKETSKVTVSERQATSIMDVPVKASTVISNVIFAAPKEDDTRQALFTAIKRLGNGNEVIQWPECVDVAAEWTGYQNARQPATTATTPSQNPESGNETIDWPLNIDQKPDTPLSTVTKGSQSLESGNATIDWPLNIDQKSDTPSSTATKRSQSPESGNATIDWPLNMHRTLNQSATTATTMSQGAGDEGEAIDWPLNIEAEPTGHQELFQSATTVTQLSEEDQYLNIVGGTSSQVTILYLHGGAYYLNCPASSRSTVTKLCERTGGRCLSPRFRLAPQDPFPASLLDILVTYLSLLSPPPDSYHDPVPASSIVLAGDSSGAAMCLALIQVLLNLRDQQAPSAPSLRFHNREVPVELPAGTAIICVAGDLLQALPSWKANGANDILLDAPMTVQLSHLPDHLWPSNPPRSDPYCDNTVLCHPLVSPVTAISWVGAPPLWIACGREMMADSAKIIAQTAAHQGVSVLWNEFEAMPHCWAYIFSAWPQSIRCMDDWAEAIQKFVEGGQVPSSAKITILDDMKVRELDVLDLTPLTPAEALLIMQEKCRNMKPYTGEVVDVDAL